MNISSLTRLTAAVLAAATIAVTPAAAQRDPVKD